MEKQSTECGLGKICETHPYTPPLEGNCFSNSENTRQTVLRSLLKQTRSKLVMAVTLLLVLSSLSNGQDGPTQTRPPAKISKTTISNGNILLNGEPFPMVLDAGTDTFTPQDYDIVMGNKDGFGANTWWLQYAMRHMRSETEGDFSALERALNFFEETGMFVNLYLRAEYRDLPDWFYEKNSDYQMLDPQGKPVGRKI